MEPTIGEELRNPYGIEPLPAGRLEHALGVGSAFS
jgi:hypothetical protein